MKLVGLTLGLQVYASIVDENLAAEGRRWGVIEERQWVWGCWAVWMESNDVLENRVR